MGWAKFVGVLVFVLVAMGSAGATWHIETVDSQEYVGYDNSIAIDQNGYPHISYLDESNRDLKYAYKTASGSWVIETVDSQGEVGYDTSIALDQNGNPHISYYDFTYGDLKYAYRDASGWYIETVDNQGNVGKETSIAIDQNGNLHISYYDFTYGDLKYAYRDASGWYIETVDSNGVVGLSTSIAIDQNGNPHISYYDASNRDLKYAYRDASGWHRETVDSNGVVGWDTSIAIDQNGNPHISYYDDTNGDLKYAYKDASGWHVVTVDSQGDVGRYTSIAIDQNGNPHISYYDYTNHDLKYAYKDASGWHVETVDSQGDVGYDTTSIAIDQNGYPHISYYDRSNRNLKYTYKDASGWEVADSGGTASNYSSVTLGGAIGKPGIGPEVRIPRTGVGIEPAIEIGLANLTYREFPKPGDFLIPLYVKHTGGGFRVYYEEDPWYGRIEKKATMPEYSIRNMDITIKYNTSQVQWCEIPIGSQMYQAYFDESTDWFVDLLSVAGYDFYDAVGGEELNGRVDRVTDMITHSHSTEGDIGIFRVSLIGANVGSADLDEQGIRTIIEKRQGSTYIYYPIVAILCFKRESNYTGDIRVWIDEIRATSVTGEDLSGVIILRDAVYSSFNDCNGDGTLSADDALAALLMSVGSMEPNPNCDVDGDGEVTSNDAAELLRAAVEG